jgi:CBS domain-containing protein
MNAYDLCQRHVVTVRRHEDLSTAAWMMRERNVGCLVVVDSGGAIGGWRPVGLLSDRDIVTTVLANENDLRAMTVEDVMTRNPVTLWSTTTVEESLLRLRCAGMRRAPVVDDRGRLIGILALDDIFEHMSQRVPFAATPIRPELRMDHQIRP